MEKEHSIGIWRLTHIWNDVQGDFRPEWPT